MDKNNTIILSESKLCKLIEECVNNVLQETLACLGTSHDVDDNGVFKSEIKKNNLFESGAKKLISPEEAKRLGFAIPDEDLVGYLDGEFIIPTNIGVGYKVFELKDGKLYPPMVKNANNANTKFGVWIPASTPPVVGYTEKEHRPQVAAKGSKSSTLSFRPGWHLGKLPIALQFIKKHNKKPMLYNGRFVWPSNLVWAKCYYSKDIDYQEAAMNYGKTKKGGFIHSRAGLPRIPKNGSYEYRTNPDPKTEAWVITGAMKIVDILSFDEVDKILTAHGITPPVVMTNDEIKKYREKLKEGPVEIDENKMI